MKSGVMNLYVFPQKKEPELNHRLLQKNQKVCNKQLNRQVCNQAMLKMSATVTCHHGCAKISHVQIFTQMQEKLNKPNKLKKNPNKHNTTHELITFLTFQILVWIKRRITVNQHW